MPGSWRMASLLVFCCVTSAASQSATLVAHWRLDELGGAISVDSTCNTLDGSYTAGTTLGVAGAAPETGTSVEFDHLAMGRVDIPDGMPLTTLASDLSVVGWIYPESLGTGRMRLLANDDSSWSCGVYTGGLIFTTRFVQDYFQPAAIPLGMWTHVAFVFDSAFDVTFYVNGASVGTILDGAPAQPPNPTWFLGHLNAAQECWDGRLDDVQVVCL